MTGRQRDRTFERTTIMQKIFLIALLCLALQTAASADTPQKRESKVNANIKRLLSQKETRAGTSKEPYTPRKMPVLVSPADRDERGGRGQLQLPPQAWPYPMVQMNAGPVLPGTAGW